MSELVWGIKNGDLDQVKDIVEKKVSYKCLQNDLAIGSRWFSHFCHYHMMQK